MARTTGRSPIRTIFASAALIATRLPRSHTIYSSSPFAFYRLIHFAAALRISISAYATQYDNAAINEFCVTARPERRYQHDASLYHN